MVENWLNPESGYSYDSNCGMALPMCCFATPIDFELSFSLYRLMLSGKAAMYANCSEIDQDPAIRRRIEVEMVASHSFGD